MYKIINSKLLLTSLPLLGAINIASRSLSSCPSSLLDRSGLLSFSLLKRKMLVNKIFTILSLWLMIDSSHSTKCGKCLCTNDKVLKCTGENIVKLPERLYRYYQPLVMELSFTKIRCLNDIHRYTSLQVVKLEVGFASFFTITTTTLKELFWLYYI